MLPHFYFFRWERVGDERNDNWSFKEAFVLNGVCIFIYNAVHKTKLTTNLLPKPISLYKLNKVSFASFESRVEVV